MLQKFFLNTRRSKSGFTYIEVLASIVFIIAAISVFVSGMKIAKNTKKYTTEITNRSNLEKDICTIFSSYTNIDKAIIEAKNESTKRGYLDTIITKKPHGNIENLYKITIEVNKLTTSEEIDENKFIFWMMDNNYKGTRIIEGDLLMWFDASDKNSLELDNEKVSKWSDKSGQNNSFVQVDEELKPVFVEGVFKDKSAIKFDNDFLLKENIPINKEYSVLLVASSKDELWTYENNANGTIKSLSNDVINIMSFNATNMNGEKNKTGGNGYTTRLYYFGSESDTKFFYGTNGNIQFIESANPEVSEDKILMGKDIFNGNDVDAYVFEYIVYNRLLDDVERQDMESYLSKKWGI